MEIEEFNKLFGEDLQTMIGVSDNWTLPPSAGGQMQTDMGLTLAMTFNTMLKCFREKDAKGVAKALNVIEQVSAKIHGNNQ